MYLCTIEGEKRTLYTIDQTVDFVEDKTMFEVDAEALRVDLKLLNIFEKVTLRDDCVIMRVAQYGNKVREMKQMIKCPNCDAVYYNGADLEKHHNCVGYSKKREAQRNRIFDLIHNERIRQDEKHPDFPRDLRMEILSEEVGEVAKARLEEKPAHMIVELIHVAAVATRWIESVNVEEIKEMHNRKLRNFTLTSEDIDAYKIAIKALQTD